MRASDSFTVRFFVAFLLAAATLAGQSYPKAWNYVPAEATALIGFDWQHLQDSFLADAVTSELSSSGHLGIPELECLKSSRQIVLSAPDFLALFNGSFLASEVEEEAIGAGLRLSTYKGVRIWFAPEKNRRSLAQVSDTLLLVGWKDTLEAVIDRGMDSTARTNAPLLGRGAKLAGNSDFWIATTELPNPLVTVFVPLGIETGDFDGAVSVRGGLRVDARYAMGSTEDAVLSAQYFRDAAASFHAILKNLHIIAEGESVLLKLDVSENELQNLMRPPELAHTEPAPAQPVGPKVVRISGLDDGPREVTLPALNQ